MTPSELNKRTKQFALRILKLCQALPKSSEGQVLGKQLLRSGTSIGANYRAACRARSRSAFISKLGIVVEEADETVYWLELISESGLVVPQRLTGLNREAEELTAIFTAARKSSRSEKS